MEINASKICSRCRLELSLDKFYKTSANKVGFESACKECKNAYQRHRWHNDKKHRDRHFQYSLKYRKYPAPIREIKCSSCGVIVKTKTSPNTTGLCRGCAKKLYSAQWTRENLSKKASCRSRRRSAQLMATPKWLTKTHLEEIEEFYVLARELAWLNQDGSVFHVDHIIPLLGRNVCGLHVPWNLQLLPASLNISKGNRYGTD